MEEKGHKEKLSKKSIFEWMKGTNGKIAIVIAFFVGYQELMPIIKDVMGFTADDKAIVEECKQYTDDQIDKKQTKAESYLDILLDDVYNINKRYERDSLQQALHFEKFAVGFRSDANGIMSYRDRMKNDCPVRLNHSTEHIEFFNQRKQKWDRCFFEDM